MQYSEYISTQQDDRFSPATTPCREVHYTISLVRTFQGLQILQIDQKYNFLEIHFTNLLSYSLMTVTIRRSF